MTSTSVNGARAALLSPLRPAERVGVPVAHPWPQPLPASWTGQLDRPEPLRYHQVEPTVVAEVDIDTAYEHHRWRHRVRYLRPRLDLSVYDVPLLLDDGGPLSGRRSADGAACGRQPSTPMPSSSSRR